VKACVAHRRLKGGAIAHGHPIGASGEVLTTRILHSMKRDGLKRGIVPPRELL
jgi:acetyl-CoA C-acetyltransferase